MKCKWEEVELSEVADLTVGFVGTMASHYTDSGVLFLRSTNIEPFNIKMNDVKYISPEFNETIKKSQLNPDDVVIVRTGKPGACTVIPQKTEPWNCSDLVIIHPQKEKINPHFLASYINLASGVINAHLVGAVQQHFNIGAAKKMKIPLPSIDIQNSIVSIIQSLNDKIELNNKINENLEQQARALLTQWLIENDGIYEFSLLSEVAVINPDTYSPKDAWEYVNYLDTSNITDGIISEIQHIKPSTEKLPSRARRIISTNDVVFSTVRPNQRHFGIISEPLDNMLASTGFAVVRSNHPSVSSELLYLCLTEDSFIEKMQQLAEQSTSTFPSIKPSDLGSCEIPYPISQDLTETLRAVFICIANNQKENRALAKLRDNLLPKLMSGELYA